jgi:hypothetical protein
VQDRATGHQPAGGYQRELDESHRNEPGDTWHLDAEQEPDADSAAEKDTEGEEDSTKWTHDEFDKMREPLRAHQSMRASYRSSPR